MLRPVGQADQDQQGGLGEAPEPEQVARQVKPLRELLELRGKLNDLRGNLQTNEKLDELLVDAVSNTEKLNKLRGELGLSGDGKEGEK